MATSASPRPRVLPITALAFACFGGGMLAGVLGPAAARRLWPGILGATGPADVRARLEPALSAAGALRVGEHASQGVWKRTVVERPRASASTVLVALRWETEENSIEASVWVPLGDLDGRSARAEIRRVHKSGETYSHGRGLEGVVLQNRSTIPLAAEDMLLVEFHLVDYDGGSAGELGERLVFRAEDFR